MIDISTIKEFLGIIVAVIAIGGPILKLNSSISKLTTKLDDVIRRLDKKDTHDENVDNKLNDHETRITLLESK